jgi:hypothetical protein
MIRSGFTPLRTKVRNTFFFSFFLPVLPVPGGGLIAYEKKDFFVHTLSNVSGYERKMRVMGLWEDFVVGYRCIEAETFGWTLLCVATEEDLKQHRGPGLVDWKRISAERKFRVNSEMTIGECEEAVLPLLGYDRGEYFLRRLTPKKSASHSSLVMQPRHGVFRVGYSAFSLREGNGQLKVSVVLMDRKEDRRGVVVKRFDGSSMRFHSRIVSGTKVSLRPAEVIYEEATPTLYAPLMFDEDSIELSDPPEFGEIRVVIDTAQLSPDKDSVEAKYKDKLVAEQAARCLLILAQRKIAERGDFFGILNSDVIRLIARLIHTTAEKWKNISNYGLFCETKPYFDFFCQKLGFEVDKAGSLIHTKLDYSALLENFAFMNSSNSAEYHRFLFFGKALLDAEYALEFAKCMKETTAIEELERNIRSMEESLRMLQRRKK